MYLAHAYLQFYGWHMRFKIEARGNSRRRQGTINCTHSEAERASQGTNTIKLFAQDFRQPICRISSESVDFEASYVRHRANLSPSGFLPVLHHDMPMSIRTFLRLQSECVAHIHVNALASTRRFLRLLWLGVTLSHNGVTLHFSMSLQACS